jgi:pilus assembly protein FimV
MQKLLRLCLWQVLIISISCFSLPISAENGGISIRGPKSTDAFPYDRYDRYGPITDKDTLWNIALKVRPDPRLSVYQVMQALYESNPDSFKYQNLNHMINGQYLKLPSIDIIQAINPDNAKEKSRSDNKAWQKKVVKVTPKKVLLPEEASVNKKDLDTAKSEINVQLQAIDSSQQQRFTTIQNDVLDSIDGLQNILKENEALRERLTSFNDQLGVMQSEVAKSKEIKVQMDDMISLQQALLSKAEAREQALLLEKQKAELEDGSFMSSSWFVALMATLPAILVLSLLAILFRRRANKEDDEYVIPAKADQMAKAKNEQSSDSLDSELTLDDELALDENSLEDELSIDLSESDEDHDELFANELDSLDDEDELEDISLDNYSETISLDDDLIEGEALEDGLLDQCDLDSLFAGLEDELDSDDDTASELDEIDSSDTPAENNIIDEASDVSDPDNIDALLDSMNDTSDTPAAIDIAEEASDVSEPDDIDALLNSINDTSDTPAALDIAEEATEVSDPDDIDARLNAINDTSDTPAALDIAEEATEVSDPDDIDARLNAINDTSDTPAAIDIAEEASDVSDPDDIDARLNAINDTNDTPAALDIAEEASDVSDPDDIDALLNSINDTSDTPAAIDIAEETSDVFDPDDIDVRLNAINDTSDTPAAIDIAEETSEVSDSDDIDARLNAINDTSDAPAAIDITEEASEVSDPDDIDARLNAINDTSDAPAAIDIAEETSEVSDSDDIDARLNAINDTSDAPAAIDIAEEASEVFDSDDIDARLNAVNDTSDAPAAIDIAEEASDVSDPDDIDALLDSMNDTSDTPAAIDTAEKTGAEQSNEVSEPDDIGAPISEDISDDEIDTSESSENEHKELINNFTNEYVQSLIDINFSNLSHENADDNLDEIAVSEPEENTNTDEQAEIPSDTSEEISDDFDIVALMDEVNHTPETKDDSPLDIGDDVLDIELLDSDLLSEETDNKSAEQTSETIDEETLAALSNDFDESTLAKLMNDEKESDDIVELSPDFTDSNISTVLLSDNDNHEQNDVENRNASNAEEVDGIKELDNLDFDDLLANIEEESSQSASDDFELDENLEIGDDYEIGDDFELVTVEEDIDIDEDTADKENAEKDFISIDSLLSGSLLDGKPTEPYKKMNIDVGLSEFPEFSGNTTEKYVDDDDNGIAEKLDLAKVYIEIGDHDNAEVILLDVIKQGDAQQQFDSQKLLDNLKD